MIFEHDTGDAYFRMDHILEAPNILYTDTITFYALIDQPAQDTTNAKNLQNDVWKCEVSNNTRESEFWETTVVDMSYSDPDSTGTFVYAEDA